ncbi:MAG: hypothetical protein ABSA54_01275 [Terriglobales bacterium]|jgi:hypothetical protein
MLGLKLVRLIERHSETLTRGLTAEICNSERTCDFRKIPPKDLQLAAAEIYRNLGEWLLQKTEDDIEGRFRAIAARRAIEGVGLHQFVWALTLTRDHLWHFLQQEAFADNIVELHGELELYQMLNQFFDRAAYYGILGYDEVRRQDSPKSDLSERRRAGKLALSTRLTPWREMTRKALQV